MTSRARIANNTIIAAGLLLAAAFAFADEVPPIETVYAQSDTVTVIGERPGSDATSAPMATAVVPAAAWQAARTSGLDEALASVPGVIAQSRAGSTDVRITNRGFGARGAGERSNAGTTRGIRVTLDGFPLTEPDGRTSMDLADAALLDRIRVVRSNSSVLYGPASGGLIELQTTSYFGENYGQGRAEFGSFGYAKQVAEVGYVAGTANIFTAAATEHFDGFREHSRGARSSVFATILSEMSPTTHLGVYLAATHNIQHLAGALTRAEYDADPTQANPEYVAQDARRDNWIGRLGARVAHDFAGGQELSVGAFVEPKTIHRSERGRYRDFQRVHAGGSALLSGPLSEGRVRWTVGVDEAMQDGTALFYNLDGGNRGTTLVADTREAINTFGTFGEVAYTPTPAWQLTAGARWDNVHYISEDHQDPTIDATNSLDQVSPRLAASYRPAENRMYFAALSRGIETPAFNEVDPPAEFSSTTSLNPLLEPSRSLTAEVGTRGSLNGGGFVTRLGYDVAVYTLEVRNEIVPWDGGATYLTAGKSRRSGVELGLTADCAAGLSARIAGTLTRNRYVDYRTNVPDGADGMMEVTYDDNESAGIPSLALQGALRYTAPFGAYLEFAAQHMGAYWANDANTDRVAAYTVFDATAGVNVRVFGHESLLFVSGRNLADDLYVASAYINGASGRYLEPGMGRNYLAGLSLHAW